MYIRVNWHGGVASDLTRISTKCPHCSHLGTFELSGDDMVTQNKLVFGVRNCPNTQCSGFLFFIYDINAVKLLATFPHRVIPIDRENIPSNVLAAFQEAVMSHSNSCYMAAGIMIRKTLEELCADKSAKGKNLKEKLLNLRPKIVVPNELMEGMDELRLLGNDAAHIESSTFNSVGEEEIEISIEFTKEILKAVYQYESLLGKIRSLKKS